MTSARKVSLVFALAALAACDQPGSPSAPSQAPVVHGHQTAVAPSVVRRHGNVITAGGAAADSLFRATAARWAADGDPELQAYIAHSAAWDGPQLALPASAEPTGLRPELNLVDGYTDLSYMNATVGPTDLKVAVNGTAGVATASTAYTGTDASSTLFYGANYATGQQDVPSQQTTATDGHFLQKSACATEIMSGATVLPDCYFWTGRVVVSANMGLSHACGEYVRGSVTSQAWYEMVVPTAVTISGSGPSVSFGWKKFGTSAPLSVGEHRAYQPSCPTQVQQTPVCGTQIIYDASTCDPNGDSSIDTVGGTNDGTGCRYYLVTISESYDGGKTWTVVSQTIEQIC